MSALTIRPTLTTPTVSNNVSYFIDHAKIIFVNQNNLTIDDVVSEYDEEFVNMCQKLHESKQLTNKELDTSIRIFNSSIGINLTESFRGFLKIYYCLALNIILIQEGININPLIIKKCIKYETLTPDPPNEIIKKIQESKQIGEYYSKILKFLNVAPRDYNMLIDEKYIHTKSPPIDIAIQTITLYAHAVSEFGNIYKNSLMRLEKKAMKPPPGTQIIMEAEAEAPKGTEIIRPENVQIINPEEHEFQIIDPGIKEVEDIKEGAVGRVIDQFDLRKLTDTLNKLNLSIDTMPKTTTLTPKKKPPIAEFVKIYNKDSTISENPKSDELIFEYLTDETINDKDKQQLIDAVKRKNKKKYGELKQYEFNPPLKTKYKQRKRVFSPRARTPRNTIIQ